jgi:hypothetical protein
MHDVTRNSPQRSPNERAFTPIIGAITEATSQRRACAYMITPVTAVFSTPQAAILPNCLVAVADHMVQDAQAARLTTFGAMVLFSSCSIRQLGKREAAKLTRL